MSCLTPGATRTDTLLPYTTLFRSDGAGFPNARSGRHARAGARGAAHRAGVKGPHRLEEPLTIGSVLLPREFPGRERGGLVCVVAHDAPHAPHRCRIGQDRKSGEEGKSVSVRVDPGGRVYIKKKKK